MFSHDVAHFIQYEHPTLQKEKYRRNTKSNPSCFLSKRFNLNANYLKRKSKSSSNVQDGSNTAINLYLWSEMRLHFNPLQILVTGYGTYSSAGPAKPSSILSGFDPPTWPHILCRILVIIFFSTVILSLK